MAKTTPAAAIKLNEPNIQTTLKDRRRSATADTIYELQGRRVSLSELRSALERKPAPLAVLYRVSDLTLVRISAY